MTEARRISITALAATLGWLVSVLALAAAWLTNPTDQRHELLTATAVVGAAIAVVFQVRSYLERVSRLVRLTLR